MEDLWKEVFPVGTEWDQYDKVYEIDWDFSNLEDAFEEGGVLNGKNVYLFGCTEPQLLNWQEMQRVIQIPAIVAVTSPFPPSNKLGIKSVQMEEEMIVPMSEMKMGWIPFIPPGRQNLAVERTKTKIFVLKCTQRRAALRQLKQERVKKYEYCLPYIYQPQKQEETQYDTAVSIMYPFDGDAPPLVTEFDWQFDEVEEFTEELVKDEALPESEKEKFMDFIKKEVAAAKAKIKEAKENKRKALAEMSEEVKKALEDMRFYKFYPKKSETSPDISACKASYINRYYGKAHEVM